MMRWTLRGIRGETRDAARSASANMGWTIGEIVNVAVKQWIEQHPEALVDPGSDDRSTLVEAIRTLELIVTRQTELLGQLQKRLGDSLS